MSLSPDGSRMQLPIYRPLNPSDATQVPVRQPFGAAIHNPRGDVANVTHFAAQGGNFGNWHAQGPFGNGVTAIAPVKPRNGAYLKGGFARTVAR